MIKNIPHSVQSRLLNLSKAISVPYQQIMTRYFKERLVSRLSQSIYVDNFILKGGAFLYAHVRESACPTLNLDFMGDKISREKEALLHTFKDIYEVDDKDGVVFITSTLKTEEIAVDKKYPGVRMSILATLGRIRQVISMDIGFGDVIIPVPVCLEIPHTLSVKALTQQPCGRVGNPQDIDQMVLFLCSDKAGFITGENIYIDGGMTRLMIYHNDNG